MEITQQRDIIFLTTIQYYQCCRRQYYLLIWYCPFTIHLRPQDRTPDELHQQSHKRICLDDLNNALKTTLKNPLAHPLTAKIAGKISHGKQMPVHLSRFLSNIHPGTNRRTGCLHLCEQLHSFTAIYTTFPVRQDRVETANAVQTASKQSGREIVDALQHTTTSCTGPRNITASSWSEQLSLILKKLMEVYRMKGEKQEMLVSLSDFEFVVKLPRMKNKLEYEAELGQLIKTALLWLEDDLSHRYGKKLLEVSPQNLLTEGYIQDKTGDVFIHEFKDYLTKVKGTEDVYTARLEKLWEERFAELGYREFKQKLNGGTLWEGSRAVSVGKHEVLLKEDAAVIRQRMDGLFYSLKTLLVDKLRKTKGRFDEEELRAIFAEHGMDVPSAKRFIGSLLESRTEEGRSVSYISSVKKKDSNELSFTVTKGFDLLLSRYQKLFSQRIVGKKGDRLLFYSNT